jgi:cutinase
VMGFVTANVVPDGVSPSDVPTPMPADVADHVTAVALFGKPSPRFMKAINDPSIVIGPQYVSKTVDLCVDNDLVCDPEGRSFSVHNQYAETGTVDQGATFVANRLQAAWTADEAAAAAAAAAVPTPTPAPQTASRPTPSPLSAPFDGSSPSAHLGWATTLPGPPPLPGPTAADALPPS